MACRTASRTAGSKLRLPLMTRETVERDKPATLATSSNVADGWRRSLTYRFIARLESAPHSREHSRPDSIVHRDVRVRWALTRRETRVTLHPIWRALSKRSDHTCPFRDSRASGTKLCPINPYLLHQPPAHALTYPQSAYEHHP